MHRSRFIASLLATGMLATAGVSALPGTAALAHTASAQQFAWSSRTIMANRAYADAPPALKLDAAGRAHLAYGGDRLHYARITAGVVATETVDAAVGRVAAVSLVIDANGQPAISFVNAAQRTLRIARRVSDQWQVATIASSVDSAVTRMAVAADGNLRVAFAGEPGTQSLRARVAVENGSGWSTQSISLGLPQTSFVPDICLPDNIAVVFDAAQRLHLGMGSTCISDIASGASLQESHHVTATLNGNSWMAGAWRPDTLAGMSRNGAGNPLAVTSSSFQRSGIASAVDDTGGHPHLATLTQPGGVLAYAACDGCTPAYPEAIGVADTDARHATLALDPQGAPHLAYLKGDALIYAGWFGNGWLLTTVDRGLSTIAALQGAFDASGQPVALYIGANGQLHVSRLGADGWSDQALDSAVSGAALATSPTGVLHIVYTSARANGALIHAWLANGTWQSETVLTGEAVADPDLMVRLAFDGANAAHVMVINRSRAQPMLHAWQAPGGWTSGVLDVSAATPNKANAWLARSGDGVLRVALTHVFDDAGQPQALSFREWDGAAWVVSTAAEFAVSDVESVTFGADGAPRVVFNAAGANQTACLQARWKPLSQSWGILEAMPAICRPSASTIGGDNVMSLVSVRAAPDGAVMLFRDGVTGFSSESVGPVSAASALWVGVNRAGEQHIFVHDLLGVGLQAYRGVPPPRVLLPYLAR